MSGGGRIHAEASSVANKGGVSYKPHDRLELNIRLYLPAPTLAWHDVDNQLKDVMDALQGRAEGPTLRESLIAPVV